MKKQKSSKVVIFMLLVFCFIGYFQCDQVYAAKIIPFGEKQTGKIGYNLGREYALVLTHKTTVNVKAKVWLDQADDKKYLYDDMAEYEDDNSAWLILDKYLDLDKIKDITLYNNKESEFTVTLEKGKYYIYIDSFNGKLNYNIEVTDVSKYTAVISTQSDLTLLEGKSNTITAKSEEKGKLLGDIVWSSSNEKIATVSATGKITAKKPVPVLSMHNRMAPIQQNVSLP